MLLAANDDLLATTASRWEARISTRQTSPVSVLEPDVAPLVIFERVTKTYDGRSLAVHDLSLAIRRGEFVTFLGPSGSGKTTSLMMLAGFEQPTSGDIRIGGRSVDRIPPYRRNIGVVFQSYALFPHMSVAENIAFPLSVRGVSGSEAASRVDRALALVRLDGYGMRRPAGLSGGQQQRVALARALVFNPDLVLMDEPLGALDKQLREELQLEIKHIHANLGVTIAYVTHDQSEALTLSDRIVVFRDGVVQQVASPSEIYERPANAFVSRFIGENNTLDGRVAHLNGGYCVVDTPAGSIRALAAHGDGSGSRVMLSVRPEHVRLGHEAQGLDNVIAATVTETIYHGDHQRLRLAVAGGGAFVLRIASGRALAPGSVQQIGWQADHCRALDASSEGARVGGSASNSTAQ